MHWLLWLSLTEAEPNNVSRLKHLPCLLYGHTPLQTPSLDFKTWTKAADKQDFTMVTVTATNHTSQREVLRCAGMGWGCTDEAQLPSPPLLLFQGQQWGRGWSAQGWCDGHQSSGPATGASLPWKKTSQPLAPAGGTAFPILAQKHLQEHSHCHDRCLQCGELGCKLWPGTEAEGLGLGRGMVRHGPRTNSTELLILLAKKVGGSSKLPHLF